MAELVDALDSGSSACKGMGVRVPLSAPRIEPFQSLDFNQRPSNQTWTLTLEAASGLLLVVTGLIPFSRSRHGPY